MLVAALGGRSETAMGLAGIGDQLVPASGVATDSTARSWGPGIRRTTRSGGAGGQGSRWRASSPPTFGARVGSGTRPPAPYHEAMHRVLFEGPGPTTSWRCSDDEPDRPDRNLAMELARVTEAAALAAGGLGGRGDKVGADQAAVDAMRFMIDSVSMDGVVVSAR